jgi:hypothetical protein
MITAIKAYGRELQPDTDHPPVKTVELEKVREEFERRYPLDDGNRSKQLATRRQVFKRSRAEAERRGLIDGREVDGVFVVWFVNPEDQALNGNASQTGRCEAIKRSHQTWR